jgi:hypothetical protein
MFVTGIGMLQFCHPTEIFARKFLPNQRKYFFSMLDARVKPKSHAVVVKPASGEPML